MFLRPIKKAINSDDKSDIDSRGMIIANADTKSDTGSISLSEVAGLELISNYDSFDKVDRKKYIVVEEEYKQVNMLKIDARMLEIYNDIRQTQVKMFCMDSSIGDIRSQYTCPWINEDWKLCNKNVISKDSYCYKHTKSIKTQPRLRCIFRHPDKDIAGVIKQRTNKPAECNASIKTLIGLCGKHRGLSMYTNAREYQKDYNYILMSRQTDYTIYLYSIILFNEIVGDKNKEIYAELQKEAIKIVKEKGILSVDYDEYRIENTSDDE